MLAWIFRFIYNAKHPNRRRQGNLNAEEIEAAEVFLFEVVQQEAFSDANDKRISFLHPFRDKDSIIRLKSSVSNRQDEESFRFPVVLPAKYPMVSRLIFEVHEKSCHVGIQGLLSLLREKYWILDGRRAVKDVISKCVICKRHNTAPFSVETPPLPLDRVKDAVPFEVTGVDYTGPLYLRSGEKVLVGLFTCAIYRAVHLELTTSLSTQSFMQVLRRFVTRRGRSKTIYSDRGTNFVGTEAGGGVPECDLVDRDAMCRRLKYRQRLQDNLRHRFRNEYLGQLKLMRQRSTSRAVTLDEVVLIGNDQEKRLVWPLGRIRERIPGKDGIIRLVRVETARGQLLRPIQRIYPLECIDTKKTLEPTSTLPPIDEDSSARVSNVKHDIKSRVPETVVKTTRSGQSFILIIEPSWLGKAGSFR
ncbi:hypothetical protein NQ315_014598 [Exocentrus adspersus]|uniref:Integrase catalytic domain-containing protein n=1 Tax=Exocentrus adspersus TaxID=1586481 RepID=A0AAV8VQ80_9CUCU|nr:hypothetical protein NQ315_014598 [Exocentrus adspersus]